MNSTQTYNPGDNANTTSEAVTVTPTDNATVDLKPRKKAPEKPIQFDTHKPGTVHKLSGTVYTVGKGGQWIRTNPKRNKHPYGNSKP